VYGTMYLQILRYFPSLPDAFTDSSKSQDLTVEEIEFFYNSLKPELKKVKKDA